MITNSGEDNTAETESVQLPDTRDPEISQHLSSEGIAYVTPVVSLLCGICSKDLISEPCSIQCDNDSCKTIFHPKCLGKSAPVDSERWVCQKCRDNVENQQIIDAPDEENDICYNCPLCRSVVGDSDKALGCDGCEEWFHAPCLFISETEYAEMDNVENWFCDTCQAVKANKIKWGSMVGEELIAEKVQAVYQEMVTWRKNLFLVPRGKSGSDFIKELTRLILLFADATKWERLSFALVHIFLPIMLQKPSSKSKARDHVTYLTKRLVKWKNGELDDLMMECRSIQKALVQQQKISEESRKKSFCRLMLLGKVKQATKFVDSSNDTLGVHSLTANIKQVLGEKHPPAVKADPVVLHPHSTPPPQEVIFERIDAETVKRACLYLDGSGGPTLTDSDLWKHIICSKSFGKASVTLAESIAIVARRLCREDIHHSCLKEFTACRLIPLDKGQDKNGNPGVRPIGIGEILRRIIGKAVIMSFKTDIQYAAGPLQTCAGLKSGIEASIHAMRQIWEDSDTEAILQVDADNAFNRLNREAALHNVHEICPPLYQYLKNHYQKPADLIINTTEDHYQLKSEEGSTQGDVAAMAFYALGIKPLVDDLATATKPSVCKQSWYADDSSAGGKIEGIKIWWDTLLEQGPKYGYYPKASKTVLIVKNSEDLDLAQKAFSGTGIKIESEGERHLGAAIGSEVFKNKYVSDKVHKWCQDIKLLSSIAVEEPQAALTAYTKGICHRWTFIQRTIPGISHLFQPLEDCIRTDFIPAILGKNVSDLDRSIFALPVRHGGLGISNPVENCNREFTASVTITKDLTDLIINQQNTLEHYNMSIQNDTIRSLKAIKEKHLFTVSKSIEDSVRDPNLKRSLQFIKEKGSGCWLTALPLKRFGYSLNKIEFRDALYLRYGWEIPNTPFHCACGERNNVNHTLICKKGGYVSMRHNNIRDLNAELQREVCRDVVTEPALIPLDNEEIVGTNADRAAPDVSSRGLWSTFERTFFDVCVTHPNSPTYDKKDMEQIYKAHEMRKMKKYNNRIIQVEKGTFTPLIYSTNGGWGPQATRYHKRLAEKLSQKRGEDYAAIMCYMRTRIRFSILRSTLIAVRGERGRRQSYTLPVSVTSFNLIPATMDYECF